jgi:hypothetical protein
VSAAEGAATLNLSRADQGCGFGDPRPEPFELGAFTQLGGCDCSPEPQAARINRKSNEVRNPLDVDECRRLFHSSAKLNQQVGPTSHDAGGRIGLHQANGLGNRGRSFITNGRHGFRLYSRCYRMRPEEIDHENV